MAGQTIRRLLLSSLLLLASPVFLTILSPTSAEAGIGPFVWLDAAYKGYDALIGSDVQAYEEGSTASLYIPLFNNSGSDITVKAARVKFDWTDGVYPAAEGDFPLALGNAESSAIAIQFTVPDTSVASNLVTHDYTVEVDYEDQIAPTVGMQISDSLGIGDGSNTRFPFDYEWSVDPGSVKVYLDGEPTTGFHQDCLYPGVILDSPPAPGISVTADYELVEEIWPGQDSRTCYLEHSPVVPGSERIYVDCVLWSAYRIDYDTGKITFDTPPTTHYAMRANYDYYVRWSFGGHDFAVYHSDQNQAMTLRQRLTAAGAPEVNTARSRELLVTSGMESRMGDQQYASGNFTSAKAHYQQALDYLQDALSTDRDSNTFSTLAPIGSLLLGIGVVLLALAAILYAVSAMRRPKL